MLDSKYSVVSPFSKIEPIISESIESSNKYKVVYRNQSINKIEKLNIYISEEFYNLKSCFEELDFVNVTHDVNSEIDYIYGNSSFLHFITPKYGMFIKGDISKINTKDFIEEFKYIYKENEYHFLRKIDTTPIATDLSFVVQGVDTDTTINLLCILLIYGKVIISTWNIYDFDLIKYKVDSEDIYNKNNIYFQVYTTLSGLKKVSTDYVIKVRGDELYLDFTTYIKALYHNNDKIVVANIIMRNIDNKAYHFPDNMIGSSKKNLIKMFEEAYSLINNGIVKTSLFHYDTWSPEQILSLGYLSNIYPMNSLSFDKSYILMKKHFAYVDVQSFKQFQIVYTKRNLRSGPKKIEIHASNYHIHCVKN
jgi:hypothetical protein